VIVVDASIAAEILLGRDGATAALERLLVLPRILRAFPIERHPHEPLLERVLALRQNISAYDAMYVALAELLNAPLITRDARLARSSGHTARIEFIE
jgi:predicted nucleic acid-binding protein